MEALAREGCDLIQGYFVSKPVPDAAVPALIDRLAGEAKQRAAG